MKQLLSFLLIFSLFSLSSCCKDDDVVTPPQEEPLKIDMKAKVKASPDKLHDGETLKIMLTDIEGLESLDKSTYKGKAEYSIEVEYLVDGKTIGSSSDKSNDFAIDYNVKGYSVGTYEVTAKCKVGDKIRLNATLTPASFVVSPQNSEIVAVTLGTNFTLSKDLFELVTPIVAYTDFEGEHKVVVTADMCKDSYFVHNDISYFYYELKQDIKADLIPGEDYDVTLSFSPKGVNADPNKRYYMEESFDINSYGYAYKNTVKIGTISNMKIDVNISINVGQEEKDKKDGLLGGQYVSEYIKQLCASPQSIKVKLDKDGTLMLGDKHY